MKLDAGSARCTVLVYREGALAAVGHDLKLEVLDFSIEVDPGIHSVVASLAAASFRVASGMADGKERLGSLSGGDKRTIEEHIVRDVLEAKRFPDIRFATTRIAPTSRGYDVEGTLALHGVSRTVAFVAARTAQGRLLARIRLDQRDFGIRPFSALLGTLRVKAHVDVEIEVPEPRP
jgi:hypothetical protein